MTIDDNDDDDSTICIGINKSSKADAEIINVN